MNMQSARASALVFAAITMGVIGCDSVQTTQPLKSAQPALAAPHSGSADLISQSYTSGSNVTAWDPIIPAAGDPNWPTTICTNNPAVGPNANWQNPHSAFELGGHPWAGLYFSAPWINAYNSLASIGPLGQSWTKYQTTVSGNGSFVIKLLADNCSWIYLDGTLVGVQPINHNLVNTQYGLTLNGTHTLTFVIFDGGGANGGKFILQTTTNPPPPLNPDLDGDGHLNTADAFPLDPHEWVDTDGDGFGDNGDAFPTNPAEHLDSDHDGVGDNADAYPNDPTRSSVDATAPTITPVVTGTLGSNGWYTSDISVSWTVADEESPITSPACSAASVTSDTDGVTFSCTAASAGGSATQSVTVKRDASTPTVTPVVTGTKFNGWYTSDATISWSVTPNGPSGATSSCGVSTQSTDTNAATFSCSAASGAGVTSSASTTVKRDATNPTIGYSGNAAVYALDQNIAISCSYGDAMSGVATQTCANIHGVAYTFGLGAHSYSASVTDNAGNMNSAATTFTVRATPASLCTMTRQFVSGPGELGVENSLCGKLDRGDYAPYINEVQAQSGKKISAANAALLILWAQSL
jgi:hypothetical protein